MCAATRRLYCGVLVGLCASGLLARARADGPFFASGIKVGEATQDSAIIWVRLTAQQQADFSALDIFTHGLPSGTETNIMMPTNVVPGVEGWARVRYALHQQPASMVDTPWARIREQNDFIHQFRLADLRAGSRYDFVVESKRDEDASPSGARIEGSFLTPAAPQDHVPVKFVVTTCQAIRSIDSGVAGHQAYVKMLAFAPDFFVHTGDILYYDKAPLSQTIAQARAKWNLMFAYGNRREFHRQVTSYFMKDDHDTLKNDCWPGQTYGQLTFDDGLGIFREQVCMGDRTYRTVRWGKDLQIWMTENRDFRSPNNIADGPDKTILGVEQKAWLKRTMTESDATFKFLISPGPLVGPDKKGKGDNHANDAFAHEGQELRDFASQLTNTYVICGDRHWQYCSQDPATGLLEFGCGPINDEHDFGGDPGEDPRYHRYFAPRGGFLGITVEGDHARAEWFSANDPNTADGQPRILHTERLPLER